MTDTNLKLSFYGSHHFQLDSKGRMSLPANFRRALQRQSPTLNDSNALMTLRHESGYIEACPQSVIANNIQISQIRALAPFFSSLSLPDKDGRLVIPKADREFMQVKKNTNIVIFGLGLSFGICADRQWNKIANNMRKQLVHSIFSENQSAPNVR